LTLSVNFQTDLFSGYPQFPGYGINYVSVDISGRLPAKKH